MTVLADLPLARRMETAEGHACAELVEARARLAPESCAEWTQVGSTIVLFDGPRSPITQTFGLGVTGEVSDAQMDAIEGFFAAHGAPASHEVSPLTGPAVLALLTRRGYVPVEFSTILYLPLTIREPILRNEPIRVRAAEDSEKELWASTAAAGWTDAAGYDLLDIMRVMAARRGQTSFLAELNGRPVAAGSLFVHEGVALLSGASTIPDARRLGAHRALFEARVLHAISLGCDLAVMCAAEPGGVSQRNAERQGFRIAYTRVKWGRPGN